MDPVIEKLPVELLGHLERAELAEFIRLLERARVGSEDSLGPVSCDGDRCSTDSCESSEKLK
jgi:hypothetical protein